MPSYNLSCFRDLKPRKIAEIYHWTCAAMALVFMVIIADGSLRFFQDGGWTPSKIVTVSLVVVFIAILWVIFLSTSAQPSSITIDDVGIQLNSRTGKSMRTIRWTAPHFKLKLGWDASNEWQSSTGFPGLGELRGFRPVNTYITREIFDEIVRMAAAKGLLVTERSTPGEPGWRTTMIVAGRVPSAGR
jgi:hypothetical protein